MPPFCFGVNCNHTVVPFADVSSLLLSALCCNSQSRVLECDALSILRVAPSLQDSPSRRACSGNTAFPAVSTTLPVCDRDMGPGPEMFRARRSQWGAENPGNTMALALLTTREIVQVPNDQLYSDAAQDYAVGHKAQYMHLQLQHDRTGKCASSSRAKLAHKSNFALHSQR
ncbi:uncharacterized protein K460DRAFT_203830 [Cucurbitaria berberidis CBS 394.84]|uniref:Uncharacterized protein n=1 Tax=Cucurbitaria berberidis CBS 394.84 TaxID=1168544 RepID=A0A9P4G6W3_9PLEO|nr:uncharacterized protein K460DRAFT_203830 [Cucurbitaria berberidis CBS 394.84]KAF1840135.1 hypothetical protein K460DRAFT_203830 [Cucurbitaria berberidis CBS 394.84]